MKFSQLTWTPEFAFIVFWGFIISTFVILHSFGFLKSFFRFGPADPKQVERDRNNPNIKEENKTKFAKFLGMNIDNWSKVIALYSIAAIFSFVHSYYGTVEWDTIKKYLNQNKNGIPTSKFVAQVVEFLNEPGWQLMRIIEFFLSATFEFQYILPSLLSKMLIDVPYEFSKISKRTFTR